MTGTLRVGSRGSRLALWQAEHVGDLIRARRPDLAVEIVIITMTGDRILDAPLARIGGKGLFTKEIEDALLDGRIDLAVHSLKDLPTALPEGLALGAVVSREDPRDVLIAARASGFDALPRGARIGTSSLRRRAQILHARDDLAVETVRGNVPTRLEKALSGALDGVILARAGVVRLGLARHVTEVLSTDLVLPAPGQGALGIEIRSSDAAARELLGGLEDPRTRAATDAERSFLHSLGGGCQVPVGALARLLDGESDLLRLEGMVADPDGKRLLHDARAGSMADAVALGRGLAADLLARGAAEILAELDRSAPPPREEP